MKLKRLGHVAVCVQDIEKSAEFYLNLGMELVWKDADWAYLKAGEDGLALLSPSYDQAGPHFGFVFDSAPKWNRLTNNSKPMVFPSPTFTNTATVQHLFTAETPTVTVLNTFTNQPDYSRTCGSRSGYCAIAIGPLSPRTLICGAKFG